MRDDRERLRDILEEISLIERYAVKGREAFETDELIQTWMVKHIENIGEAVRTMSKEYRALHSHIPWDDIVAQRSYLAHEYFSIDKDEVWETIVRDIPRLKAQITCLLEE